MRIAYCTNVRLPSERAHGHQVARVCDALAALGHEVTIIAPYRKEVATMDYWDFHGADRRVLLKKPVKDFDPINNPLIPGFLKMPLLNWRLKKLLQRELAQSPFALLYTRTPALLPLLLLQGIPVILELHTLPNRSRENFVSQCNRCALVVCLTSPMRNELASCGVDSSRVIVEADAVQLEKFSKLPEKKSARAALGLRDPEKFTVGYAGSLRTMGLEKGVHHLQDAVALLRSRGRDIDEFIVSTLPQQKMPLFYAACDALIYPAPKTNHPYFLRDTSPLKIFEYMAAGKPIVTADLPPIRDVLDESTAFFCKPGDAEDMARAITEVLDQPEEARKRTEAARKKVEHYTWDKRMQRILAASRLPRSA